MLMMIAPVVRMPFTPYLSVALSTPLVATLVVAAKRVEAARDTGSIASTTLLHCIFKFKTIGAFGVQEGSHTQNMTSAFRQAQPECLTNMGEPGCAGQVCPQRPHKECPRVLHTLELRWRGMSAGSRLVRGRNHRGLPYHLSAEPTHAGGILPKSCQSNTSIIVLVKFKCVSPLKMCSCLIVTMLSLRKPMSHNSSVSIE